MAAAAATSRRSDMLGTVVALLFLFAMGVNFAITQVGSPTENNSGVRVRVRDRLLKSTASNTFSTHDSPAGPGRLPSTSIVARTSAEIAAMQWLAHPSTAASDASVGLATHSPGAADLATRAPAHNSMTAFQKPSFDVEPLVPLSKLAANESDIFLACQRSSFARYQRPPALGGPRFVIVQTVEFGRKSKPMVCSITLEPSHSDI